MTADGVKASLAKAAARAWPNAAKASDLPFPEYWKAVTEWLTFHAPHVGDELMQQFIDGYVASAKAAEERGETPTPPKVSEEVRAIWANAGRGKAAKAEEKRDAWEHAAERAAETRDFFAKRSRRARLRGEAATARQGRTA